MNDPLSDTLAALRLRGTVYFRADFAAPWGMDFRPSEVANFHLVAAGECFVGSDNLEPTRLTRGDVVVFPHGHSHRIACEVGADVMPAATLIETTRRDDGDCVTYGGQGAKTTTLLCGHFTLERRGGHPLLAALPSVILLRGNQGGENCISAASQLAVAEAERDQSGSAALVDRLAEILLIEIIRGHAAAAPSEEGFLAALDNQSIALALAAIHAKPESEWTLEMLAREAAMSRSGFSALFTRLVGASPMKYVTLWRMHRARELLLATQETIASIAARVGYESEFGFAKAYKRELGEAPGQTRRRTA